MTDQPAEETKDEQTTRMEAEAAKVRVVEETQDDDPEATQESEAVTEDDPDDDTPEDAPE